MGSDDEAPPAGEVAQDKRIAVMQKSKAARSQSELLRKKVPMLATQISEDSADSTGSAALPAMSPSDEASDALADAVLAEAAGGPPAITLRDRTVSVGSSMSVLSNFSGDGGTSPAAERRPRRGRSTTLGSASGARPSTWYLEQGALEGAAATALEADDACSHVSGDGGVARAPLTKVSTAEQRLRVTNWKLESALEIGRAKLQEEMAVKETVLKEREVLEEELHELTASLFDEANRQVQDEMRKTDEAEKKYKEAQSSLEVLQAEVRMLKERLAQAPPPLSPSGSGSSMSLSVGSDSTGGASIASKFQAMKKAFKSSPNMNAGLAGAAAAAPALPAPAEEQRPVGNCVIFYSIPLIFSEGPLKNEFSAFLRVLGDLPANGGAAPDEASWDAVWSSAYMQRCLWEDVRPCLYLHGAPTEKLRHAVRDNDFAIEALAEAGEVETCVTCRKDTEMRFRIKIGADGPWADMCKDCRRRVVAVGNFYTFIRYLRQGLVRAEADEIWEKCQQLRQRLSAARFGLESRAPPPKAKEVS